MTDYVVFVNTPGPGAAWTILRSVSAASSQAAVREVLRLDQFDEAEQGEPERDVPERCEYAAVPARSRRPIKAHLETRVVLAQGKLAATGGGP